MKITRRQREMLRHAIAWPNGYRNHFYTGDGSDDHADCEKLVGAGMMRRLDHGHTNGRFYAVTDEGKKEAAK